MLQLQQLSTKLLRACLVTVSKWVGTNQSG